jgi:hypothetical protein
VLGLQAADFDLESFQDWGRQAMEENIRLIDLRAMFVEEALEADVRDGFG